jgi:hypothetical protein
MMQLITAIRHVLYSEESPEAVQDIIQNLVCGEGIEVVETGM